MLTLRSVLNVVIFVGFRARRTWNGIPFIMSVRGTQISWNLLCQNSRFTEAFFVFSLMSLSGEYLKLRAVSSVGSADSLSGVPFF